MKSDGMHNTENTIETLVQSKLPINNPIQSDAAHQCA